MVYIPQAKLTLEQIESEQARVIHVRTNKSVQETILRMALCTSTPKSKLLETASLLSLDSENEDNSSGYDSPVYISKNAKKKNCRRKLPVTELSHDDDSSDDAISYDDFSPGDYDSDDDIKTHSIQSMRVTSTDTLVENIKYIISIPELCDVVFIVGPHRVTVYGLKAILSTRSRVFFALFLKHQKEAMKDKKKPRKSRQNLDQGNRLSIIVDNYDADVFRNFLLFVHCGTVLMDPTTVTGILCLATEYDIPDLRKSCWQFIERCITVPANASIMIKHTFRYSECKAAQKLRLQILRLPAEKRSSSIWNLKSDNKYSSGTNLNSTCNSNRSIETIV